MVTKKCKRCGKEFTTEKNAQKFCSIYCGKRYNIFGAKQTEFTCAWCGKTFTSNIKRTYCCVECREQSTRSRRLKHPKAKTKSAKPKNFMSIEEVARASKEMGMSAGEYMAKFCYGKEG